MTALYILLFLLFFIVLLLCTKIVFSFKFDGNIRFSIRFLFIKFGFNIPVLYKSKETEAEEKEEEEYVYVKKKTSKKKKKSKKEDKLPFPGLKNAIVFFKDAVIDVFGKVIHSFRLEKMHFRGIAASKDAAKTAELYGAMCTAASALHQFATNAKGIKKNAVYIEVLPDFLAETPDFYADLKFSIRLFRILLILKKVLSVWFDYKKLCYKVLEEKKNDETNQN